MRDFEVMFGSRQFLATVQDVSGGLHVTIDGRVHRIAMHPWVEPTHFVLSVDGMSTPVAIERSSDGLRVTIGSDQCRLEITPRVPIPRRGSVDRAASPDVRVVAPMPGLIVVVQASPGSHIAQGAPVVIMEAMKMQMEIRAPRSGRVSAMSVQPGQEVAKGQILAIISSQSD